MGNLILGKIRLGKAVFANSDFKNGEKIIEFKGDILKRKELPAATTEDNVRYVQVGKNAYLEHSGDYGDFFNHSCNPNSGLKFDKGKIFLFAIADIKKGEEIKWDYSTTMDEDNREAECWCKNKSCRGKIRDFKYLPKKVQKRYIELGIVPKYVIKSGKKK